MISSIKISLFRGIRDCRIDDLKAINVFVGRNNHGKSSILEALYLASGAFKFEDPWSIEQQRGTPAHRTSDKISFLLNRRTQRRLTWGRDRETLWHNYDRKDSIKIDIVRKGKKLRIRLADWHMHPFLSTSTDQSLRDALNKDGYPVQSNNNNFCLIESSVIEPQRMFHYSIQTEKVLESQMRLSEMSQFMQGMMFIDSSLIHNMETVEKILWKPLLRKRQDKLVVEVLRNGYESEVEDLTYIPYGERYQLAIKLPETTTRVDDLGDGARYSMIWIMVAALAERTAILMEEPENHQHPSGLAKSLEMLLSIAKTNKTQLFITTHSLEFIKLLEKIAEEMRIDVKTFFIERDETGKIEPRVVTSKDSEYLAKMGLDMRFLDIL